ncbi:MAG: 23S rRNA (guanosine(2251)-2'-O)-methyltransferase RlmB [Sulfobacillus benefaciens]|uniref:23S rRNA (Guanosine(2251)-2'-O)-methyltransferase RlmB n=1 Tax=Sulfobacillus benefaciens TaxID=453960 RepID=A0A2T2XCA7_9FIRM|nr:MAG: 23S rRNA (guanosine(2251)-2'-O)-methyltransferase RlmB [Sulfobacillus benefaciens]
MRDRREFSRASRGHRDEFVASSSDDVLIGRHPVREALRTGRPMSRILVQDGTLQGSLGEIISIARATGVPVHKVPRPKLDQIAGDVPHQGIAAYVAVRRLLSMKDAEELIGQAEEPFVFILDGIQDPHNLGAILRVANAVSCTVVIIPERGAAGLTATVAKASAGAVEYVPVVGVTNIAQSIVHLKELGIFVFGADPGASTRYYQNDWTGSVGIVIGAEGQGIRPLVKQRCDGMISLPMMGQVGSLNAATAAAVLGFEVLRQRSVR